MAPPISADEMRGRLLRSPDRPVEPQEDWLQVLSASGNRDLLGLIGRARPQSIGALADLVGRAQPNVSRALSALVGARLVTIMSDGRRSVPSLTQLGSDKAVELGLLGPAPQGMVAEASEDGLFAVAFCSGAEDAAQPPAGLDGDAIEGTWSVGLWLRDASERAYASWEGDLNASAIQLLKQWWRMLYRRDAPLKLGEFELAGRAERKLNLIVTSTGHAIELVTRANDGEPIELSPHARRHSLDRFEVHLIDEFIRPIVYRQRAVGRMDRSIQSALSRLEDSRSNAGELIFCRAAGALGLSPYDLDGDVASRVRELVASFSDEDARLDFASAVLAEDLDVARRWTRAEVERHRDSNRLEGLSELRTRAHLHEDRVPKRPWQRGRDFARAARSQLSLGMDTSLGSEGKLIEQVGGDRRFETSCAAPGSMRGFQSVYNDAPVIVVGDEGFVASNFVLARAIGDYLVFGSHDVCVADLYTDRQAVGRAFAAEFLAPGEGVARMLDEGAPVHRVANHFGVATEVVRRQYENFGHW